MEIVANIKKQKQEIDKVVGMICIDFFFKLEISAPDNCIYYHAVTEQNAFPKQNYNESCGNDIIMMIFRF